MSAAADTTAAPTVPVMTLAVMMRQVEQALRDGTWKDCPVGSEVDRYLRVLKWGGAADNTLDSYRPVLALFALRHADYPTLGDFCSAMGTELIREFLDAEWGSAAPSTKRQRAAIVRSFFKWAALERRIPYNPAETIKSPRVRARAARQAYPIEILHTLVNAQQSQRDQCALQLMCRLGLRKNELRLLRYRDLDLVRGYILVHGKGGNDELLPLIGGLAEDLRLLWAETGAHPDAYLMTPVGRAGPMNPATVHRWFKRCVDRAGLPETVMMHELRHSAADAVYRVRGDVAQAQMLLRHESLATTQAYLHPTKRDLADTLRALDEAWAEG